MNKPILGVAACAVVLGALWSASFAVSESETAIVARFGDPRRHVDKAGLHFKWPAPIDTVWRVDRRIRMLDVAAEEFLTSDKKNLLVGVSVAWSVADPLRFLLSANSIEQVESRLSDLVQTQLGNVLGAYPFAALIAASDDAPPFDAVDDAIVLRAGEAAGETYGVTLHVARITSLTFPDQNKRRIFSRMEAERQKIAQEIRSEGVEQSERIRSDAELEASKLVNEAKRERDERIGRAQAEAARILNEAHARDPALYELLRTLETLETVFGPDDTLVLPSDHPLLRLLNDAAHTELGGESVGTPPADGEPGEDEQREEAQ